MKKLELNKTYIVKNNGCSPAKIKVLEVTEKTYLISFLDNYSKDNKTRFLIDDFDYQYKLVEEILSEREILLKNIADLPLDEQQSYLECFDECENIEVKMPEIKIIIV